MTSRPSAIDRRLLDAARTPAQAPSIFLLAGACGSGRTERLQRLHRALGPRTCQFIDVERIATTPERCFRAIVSNSPFVAGDSGLRGGTTGARSAFDALLMFLMNATQGDGTPATFLLDEVLELRTFESFPGLRSALAELARALANSPNRFILSTRFGARAARWIDGTPERFELLTLAPLSIADVRDSLGPYALGPQATMEDAEDLAHTVQALADGRPGYVRGLLDTLTTLQRGGGADPISALAAGLARGGELDTRCRFSYELRLHRARGYGALKAILDVLADEEPLTLTQIAQRLGRTPGSTKDYLSWLQDVDLINSHRKRYSYADPLLRLWVRLHSHVAPLDDERTSHEVQEYAMRRLQMVHAPAPESPARTDAGLAAPSVSAASSSSSPQAHPVERTLARAVGANSGIIEID